MDQIDSAYKVLSISHQCKLLGISRSQYYYEPSSRQDEKDFNLLVKIKEAQIEHPYYGYRRIWREINKNGGDTTETTVRRVMRRFGITARFHQSLDYNVPDEMYKCFQYNELERKRDA